MIKVKRPVFMPEALSRPVPLTAPATEVDRLMLVICEWARVDPLVLAGETKEAAEEWEYVARFLAANLLPCFKVLRAHQPRRAGRRSRTGNALNPSYNPGSPLTPAEEAWLMSTIDGIKTKKGCGVLKACEELKTCHRKREFVALRAKTTLRHLYYEACKRGRRGVNPGERPVTNVLNKLRRVS
jgi:hypothetical protein